MTTTTQLNNFILVKDYSLKNYNTLRIDSKAALIVFPLNNSGVEQIIEMYENRKLIFLGNGSNILLSKHYYDENYVFVSFKHMSNISFNNGTIDAQAGATLSMLSWFALELNVKGYEFLEDVPGSIGGATVMNAGTYKDMIGDLVSTVTYYSCEDKRVIIDKAQKTDFGRRYSKWGNRGDIILSVSFDVKEDERLPHYMPILEELLENKKKRYMKQPRNYPNAGSVFKRPKKDGKDYYVWELFEDCNLRGYRIGNAMISDKHPGFIVNIDNAKPEDVLSLINAAKTKVKNKHNIDLELEWTII